MRLFIDQTVLNVHAIEPGGRVGRRRFWLHLMPGSRPGSTVQVSGEVLGDALRARFDELERRVEFGDLEYVTVGPEMNEIEQALMDHRI